MPPGQPWGITGSQSQGPQQPPGQPPMDDARVREWTRGIPNVNPPTNQQQATQQNGFDHRDSMRAPPPRAPSPRQEQMRGFGEPPRHTPVRKMQSPSPKMQHVGPSAYPASQQTLPQISMHERGPSHTAGVRPSPIMNGGQGPSSHAPPPASNLPPYGRPFSPPSELRPLRDEQPRSPPSGYPQHHPSGGQAFPSIANNVTTAPSPLPTPAEAPRDDRPPSAMKRGREWESDGPSKKPANDETRAGLDDIRRRQSPPNRITTPHDHYRRSSSEIRRENERRANENYHPSEAAHHPYSLAPQQMPSMSTILDSGKDDRKEPAEQAARKMDVDEDYDNNSEDDRKAGSGTAPGTATKNSPMQSTPTSALPKQEVLA